MGNATYTLGGEPTITIERVDGDLTVVGQAGETVTLTGDTMPESTHDGNRLVIAHCDDDLHLAVPPRAMVIVTHVHGDLRAERLSALQVEEAHGGAEVFTIARSCTVRRVHGDLRAADLGELSAATVAGDARVERVGRSLRLGRVDGDATLSDVTAVALGAVGGDLRLDRVQGTLALEHVQGDAFLRGAPGGFGPAHVGGDLKLEIAFARGEQYRLSVDGDGVISVPDDADLTLDATVHGDVRGSVESRRDGTARATWGQGSATLALTVGGDLQVRGAAARPRSNAPAASGANGVAQDQAAGGDPMLDVLEALARGDISPAEADDLLSRR
jgi:hypothetical protein